jgi:hypothetical protein
MVSAWGICYPLDMGTAVRVKKTRKPSGAGAMLLAIAARARKIPSAELQQAPTDGATNHDHYLYGSPKKR